MSAEDDLPQITPGLVKVGRHRRSREETMKVVVEIRRLRTLGVTHDNIRKAMGFNMDENGRKLYFWYIMKIYEQDRRELEETNKLYAAHELLRCKERFEMVVRSMTSILISQSATNREKLDAADKLMIASTDIVRLLRDGPNMINYKPYKHPQERGEANVLPQIDDRQATDTDI